MIRVFITTLFCLFSFISAAEDKVQDFVVSYGQGIHNFSSEDDVREGQGADNEGKINSGAYTHLNIDWFPYENWGFGYRSSTIEVDRNLEYSDGTKTEESVKISSIVYTINYILTDPKDEWRFVTYGGLGDALYQYDYKVNASSTCFAFSCEDTNGSTNGDVQMFGVYADYGNEGIGVRLGYNLIYTNFDTLKDGNNNEIGDVDADGNGFFVDVRYSW